MSEGYDIGIRQMVQSTSAVTVTKLGVAVQCTDEAIMGGYGDPISEVSKQIALSLDDALDTNLLAKLAAVTSADHVYEGASTGLVPADVPLALAKFGEDMDGTKALVVTPAFYAKLIGTDWIPASEIAADVRIKGAAGMAYGCQVIVSNRLTTAGNLYIIKPDTLAVFIKRGVFVESDRDILNESTVIKGSILCAPYLLNPNGMVKMVVGD